MQSLDVTYIEMLHVAITERGPRLTIHYFVNERPGECTVHVVTVSVCVNESGFQHFYVRRLFYMTIVAGHFAFCSFKL